MSGTHRIAIIAAGFGVLAACSSSQSSSEMAAQSAAQVVDEAPATELRCQPQRPVENRASPYDSTTITIGNQQALICYGRPSSRGRTMIGGSHVPYGKLWRTGANEPTTLHIPFAAEIAGVRVAPGSYSLYTVPNIDEWEIIINRSTSQWGVEGQYTAEIEAQEVGRGRVRAEVMNEPLETFTIRSVPAGSNAAEIVLEWERTRVRVPIEVAG